MPQIKRQAVAEPRILTESLTRPTAFGQEIFPQRAFYNSPANRQLFLQSVPAVPSAPQNFLTEQSFGQAIKFGLAQPSFPLGQGYVSPQLSFETIPRPQAALTNPVKFESFPKPLPTPQVKTFISQPPKPQDSAPQFVDGYRAENTSNNYYSPSKKPQSLQKIKFENTEKVNTRTEPTQNGQKLEREEVQLLYVPVESLNRGQFNFRSPITSPQIVSTDIYNQGLPNPTAIKQTYTNFQRPTPKSEMYPEQTYVSNFNQFKTPNVPKYSTTTSPFPTAAPTTPKLKKLKPHQPPLAIFLSQETGKTSQMKVGDVLSSLKTASTIAVLDSVNPLNAPKVFIGPSTLTPPDHYVKFELPYLSNIQNSDKKLKQLPFFVAPLSYNTPQGFAKIPFPSPHVGSVVINAQIKEPTTLTTVSNVVPQSYYPTTPPRKEQKPVTQKPSVSFYSTVPPRANTNFQTNYYSFEPQMVSSIKPQKEEVVTLPPKRVNYFLNNAQPQYTQHIKFPDNNFSPQETYRTSTQTQPTTTTTQRPTTTTSTTTAIRQSTYPSQLLETHNPYSINQAFHFSTPLDYHSYFEDIKEPSPTPGPQDIKISSTLKPITTTTQTDTEVATQRQYQQQSTPNYAQSYRPEVHYESEVQNSRYPVYNTNDYVAKSETNQELEIPETQSDHFKAQSINENPTDYTNTKFTESKPNISEDEHRTAVSNQAPSSEDGSQTYEYNRYETIDQNEDTTTTTTTEASTRKNILRTRGRPRYTTSRPNSNESTTRYVATRRPLRERRPLPTRNKYEPNRLTTEKPKTPVDSNESTTRATRTRTRGRIQYRPTGTDYYDRKVKSNGKEEDLAYQRDVLHQNYPVTLMERSSTVDIEAITEPAKAQSDVPKTESLDTENAYSNEKMSFSQSGQSAVSEKEYKEDIYVPKYSLSGTGQTEPPYVPFLPSTRNEEYYYPSSDGSAPAEQEKYLETDKEESYSPETTSVNKSENFESNAYVTDIVNFASDDNLPAYSINDELSGDTLEDPTTPPDIEVTKVAKHESNSQEIEDDDSIETTPSYHRVRVRPGVVRQYHQSTTESSRVKSERRRPQGVTYRPAYDRKRTTMRIEEIEADLKTKQVHSRPEVEDFKHPVYKPEPSTEPVNTDSQETTTKRGHFRRRRPSYSHITSTTESSVTRRTYDIKNRFRGRRPTEKPSEKPEPTEVISSTTRSPLYTRYSPRPKLSERYTKKQESEEDVEDQDSNFSINRPSYVEPDSIFWSPKITNESFKPFNPNNIGDDKKAVTTERRSDRGSEMDIITVGNQDDDILISVTPAYNNRNSKNIPEIPPTLEAFVEQSKITKPDSVESMSTFESMLEEVMKSLEEQDQDEYTTKVMKHKGGEIGEIPPETISSDDASQPTSIAIEETTAESSADTEAVNEEEQERKTRRRGFWKKIKVRPVTDPIDVAESQYYSSTVNRLGQPIKNSKYNHEKSEKYDKKIAVTTYKPAFQFIKDLFESNEDTMLRKVPPTVEITKIKETEKEDQQSTSKQNTTTEKSYLNPGDLDLGTGSPDPTIDDFYLTTTEATKIDRSEGFSFMDYFFGARSQEKESQETGTNVTTKTDFEITTESKPGIVTTETTYIPDEITTESNNESNGTPKKDVSADIDISASTVTPTVKFQTSSAEIETSSMSSFMDPANVVSTSMTTQVSHETEICFRGKCIKTSKSLL
ncbi:flocculation protein FLO11 [Bombyx mandarina]|uniref:Flocculation protein FLO11 n=1 Tax=Bombyx mandarina TaxID=7092 RepID=A0A6J2KCH6_BOMMA|nr:flocculation protein FLO11 [Bombyx mandarina]